MQTWLPELAKFINLHMHVVNVFKIPVSICIVIT